MRPSEYQTNALPVRPLRVCSGSDLHSGLLQTSVDRISGCALQHGFRLSPQKTVGDHFYRKRGEQTDPILYLNNQQILFKESVKFLGLIFDYQLNWKNHISQLRSKCIKAMSLMRTLSHLKWGADRQSLLGIYRAVIRSKIDCGSQVYGSAKPNMLKKLDPVHNMALRYCTGAFGSSPIVSLCAESGEPPLQHRRDQLLLQQCLRIYRLPNYNAIFDPVVVDP